MGRGFSHDVSALDSSGVLTPEARQCHFSAACSACVALLTSCEISALFLRRGMIAVARLFRGKGFSLDHVISPRVCRRGLQHSKFVQYITMSTEPAFV